MTQLNQAQKNRITQQALTPLPEPHLTGMKLQEDIILNDFVFNTVDEYGVLWVITDIKGWWSPPAPDMPDIKRGWADGSYDVKGRYNARDLTLEGSILCTDPSLAAEARRRLVAQINLVRQGGWLKTNENPTKASWVRLSGEPNFETVNARGRIDFSIGLRAADPIKYSWNELNEDGYDVEEILAKSTTPARSGKSTLTNQGDFDVSAYFIVTGPVTGPAIILNETNGESIAIVEPLRSIVTGTIISKSITGGVVTLTTSAAHVLQIGDSVEIFSLGTGIDGDRFITARTSNTFTFIGTATDTVNVVAVSGTYTFGPDILEIDTYNRETSLNGEYYGARMKLEVYNDWVTLSPGENVISFYDNGNANSTAKLTVEYRSGWLA
jgi:hypothetical protein